MEIAKLEMVLAVDNARKQITLLEADMLRLEKLTQLVGIRASKALNDGFARMAAGGKNAVNSVQTDLFRVDQVGQIVGRRLGASFQDAFRKMTDASKTAGRSVDDLLGKRFTTSAATAESAISGIGKRLLAVFSVQQGVRFAGSAIDSAMDFERINNTLKLVTGSAQEAGEQFSFLQRESNRIGINFVEAAERFTKFEAAARGTGITTKQLKETFLTVAEAGRVFGLTVENQGRIFRAIEQMVSKGVVSMEELRQQLGDALPGAFQIAARAMNMTGQEFNKLVASGNLMTKDFLAPFTKELAKMAPAGESVLSTAAEINRLTNAWDNFKASVGKAIPTSALARGATSVLQAFTPNTERQNESLALQRRFALEGLDLANTRRFPNDTSIDKAISERLLTDKSLAARAEAELLRRETATSGTRAGIEGFRNLFGGVSDSLRGMFPTPTTAQQTKFNRFQRGLADDGMSDRESLVQRYQNQSEAVKEMGLTWRQEAEAIELVNKAKEKALTKFDLDKALKAEEEAAKDLTDAYLKNEDALFKFTVDAMDPAAAAAAKASEEYRRQYLELLQLDEAGADVTETMNRLNQAFTAQQAEIGRRRNRAGFTGESFAQLVAGRDTDERGLLTETDADRFNETTQRIQDRSAEMTRRLKGDAAEISEAFSLGFDEQAKSWGSFQQRVATGGAELASSFDRSFTDAFTSMIMGTESAAEAFRQMSASIVSDLVRIAVQQLVVRQLIQGIGAIGSLAGGAGGATANPSPGGAGYSADFAIMGPQHDGGVIGSSFGTRTRAHDGAVMGDEMPIVARKNEVVFTPEQVNVLGKAIGSNNQSKAPQKLEIYNGVDNAGLTEHLMRNPDIVVNIIGRRANVIRKILAS